ncbi:glycosyltransferase family 39 protein [Thermodesulfobacteriota bacterium]
MEQHSIQKIEVKPALTPPNWLLGLLIFLYPFFFIFQGGDLSDTGYFAIRYQNFFNDFREGIVSSQTFLTYFVGGWWMRLFPSAGVLGILFPRVLLFHGTMLFIYFTLKDIKPRKVLLVSMLCGEVFAFRFTSMVLSYNSFSLFFLTIMVSITWRGIKTRKDFWFFGAGIFLSLASLARIPNVLILPCMMIFLAIINLYDHKNKNITMKIRNTVKQNTWLLAGVFFVLLCFLAILKSSGQLVAYSHGLFSTVNVLSSVKVNSPYSFVNLLANYWTDFKQFFPYAFGVTFAIFILSYVRCLSKKSWFKFFVSSLFVLFFVIHFYGDFSYRNSIKYFSPAICILPIWLAFRPNSNIDIQRRSLILLVCMCSLIHVAGTNTGLFLKLGWWMPFLFPLLACTVWEQKTSRFYVFKIQWPSILKVVAVVIVLVSVINRIGWIYHVDTGELCRLRAIYPVNHSLMRGIYTTKKRADHIEAVMRAINMNLEKDDSFFIYGHQPLFYYLAAKRPPIQIFWMANRVSPPDYYFSELNKFIARTNHYPLVLITNKKILGDEGNSLLEDFLIKNRYLCIEKLKTFEIWKVI